MDKVQYGSRTPRQPLNNLVPATLSNQTSLRTLHPVKGRLLHAPWSDCCHRPYEPYLCEVPTPPPPETSPVVRYSFIKDALTKESILADLERRFTVFEAKSKKKAKMLASLMG